MPIMNNNLNIIKADAVRVRPLQAGSFEAMDNAALGTQVEGAPVLSETADKASVASSIPVKIGAFFATVAFAVIASMLLPGILVGNSLNMSSFIDAAFVYLVAGSGTFVGVMLAGRALYKKALA